jgi:hypothetical protein
MLEAGVGSAEPTVAAVSVSEGFDETGVRSTGVDAPPPPPQALTATAIAVRIRGSVVGRSIMGALPQGSRSGAHDQRSSANGLLQGAMPSLADGMFVSTTSTN